LGFVIYQAYHLTGNYGLAILLFALVTRIVLFPVSIMTHRNSIRLLQLQPSLIKIKRRYSGEKERLNEERYELFKKEKYSPLIGIIPLIIQLILIMGVMQVMYNPFQHLLHIEKDTIETIVITAREAFGVQEGSGEQLRIIEILRNPENIKIFQSALLGFPDAERALQSIASIDLSFLGLNLGEIPSPANPSIVLLIPLISALTALGLCLNQSAISPGALSQGKSVNWGLTALTVAVTAYFTLVTPIGVGVYWSAKNLIGILSLRILNQIQSPEKLAGEALAYIKSIRKTPAQLKEERQTNKKLRIREKQDAARFSTAKKQLVFYAKTGGQYKYYKTYIEYILENSKIIIHYLTNEPDDALFAQSHERLLPYYASEKKTISLFLKMDTDILVTTVPGLQSYHMKRSIIRDDIEYIYVPHGMVSGGLVVRENATDNFNTIFCVNSNRVAIARKREELAKLPKRKLVKVGSGIYDQLVESYTAISDRVNDKPHILIAPSWQNDNILELCIDSILDALLGQGYVLTIRPHPQFIKMFPEKIDALKNNYSQYESDGELLFGLDFFDNQSIFKSDILITDWSNIAYEFSYATLKPSIFINTPMKVLNPNYKQHGQEVQDITFRDKVGVSVDVKDVGKLNEVVSKLLNEKDTYKERIGQLVQQNLYHPGRSGEAGGRYIISRLKPSGVDV
jgi:YidC/Oxa1 family membrane protein insertase